MSALSSLADEPRAAYLILFAAARLAEATVSPDSPYDYKLSPAWLLGMYATLTVAELMLSPMGLSLVANVAHNEPHSGDLQCP
jgi:dipeptide/tripeptide permease